jgi:hypothetical protein
MSDYSHKRERVCVDQFPDMSVCVREKESGADLGPLRGLMILSKLEIFFGI